LYSSFVYAASTILLVNKVYVICLRHFRSIYNSNETSDYIHTTVQVCIVTSQLLQL